MLGDVAGAGLGGLCIKGWRGVRFRAFWPRAIRRRRGAAPQAPAVSLRLRGYFWVSGSRGRRRRVPWGREESRCSSGSGGSGLLGPGGPPSPSQGPGSGRGGSPVAKRSPPWCLPAARSAFFLPPAAVCRTLAREWVPRGRGSGPGLSTVVPARSPHARSEDTRPRKLQGGSEVTSLWRQEHYCKTKACEVRDSDCCLCFARPVGKQGKKRASVGLPVAQEKLHQMLKPSSLESSAVQSGSRDDPGWSPRVSHQVQKSSPDPGQLEPLYTLLLRLRPQCPWTRNLSSKPKPLRLLLISSFLGLKKKKKRLFQRFGVFLSSR